MRDIIKYGATNQDEPEETSCILTKEQSISGIIDYWTKADWSPYGYATEKLYEELYNSTPG